MRNPNLNTVVNSRETQKIKELQQGMAHCLSNPYGVLLFQHILKECNFHSSSVAANPATGEVFVDSTVYCEARRNLWLHLRTFIIDRNQLIHVEIPEPPQIQQEEPPLILEELNHE